MLALLPDTMQMEKGKCKDKGEGMDSCLQQSYCLYQQNNAYKTVLFIFTSAL
jgi:hypothetical protein